MARPGLPEAAVPSPNKGHIHALFREVLVLIFGLFGPTDDDARLDNDTARLLTICRYWNQIILSESSLWTYILIDPTVFVPDRFLDGLGFTANSARSSSTDSDEEDDFCVETELQFSSFALITRTVAYLERSQSSLLHIHIRIGKIHRGESTYDCASQCLKLALGPQNSHYQRWGSLGISRLNISLENILTLLEFDAPALNLTHIYIVYNQVWVFDFTMCFKDTPRLRHLSVTSPPRHQDFSKLIDKVTTPILIDSGNSFHVVNLLLPFSNLTHLTLTRTWTPRVLPPIMPHVVLPRLVALNAVITSGGVINHLTLPVFRSLAVTGNYMYIRQPERVVSEFFELVSKILPQVEELELDLIQRSEGEWALTFAEMPSLRSLFTPRIQCVFFDGDLCPKLGTMTREGREWIREIELMICSSLPQAIMLNFFMLRPRTRISTWIRRTGQ